MKKPKRYYVVMRLQDTVEIKDLGDRTVRVGADNSGGICGYLPCFTNKRKAQRYAGKKYTIAVVEEVR